MANTAEKRELFNSKSQCHKDSIKKIFENEKKLLAEVGKDPVVTAHKKIELAEIMIHAATLYIAINELSFSILELRNNDALNEARKIIYKAIIYLEDVVSNGIDIPFSDIDDKLELIADYPLDKRYYLVRKLGLCIRLLVDAFGENSKWKWSFVEIQGRFTTVMKNLLDWKQANKDYYDSGSENYTTTVFYIRLVRKHLEISSKEYRDRYELATHRLDDMRAAVNYLGASRRIAVIIDEKSDAEEFRKKAQVWREKLESDQKKGLAT
ncbi:MAG: hypothetical protein K6B43_01765 [Treponema sp.]|nr:hypothetical protein [Treponema sp.]